MAGPTSSFLGQCGASLVPGAVVGLDLHNTGEPDVIVAGPDTSRDGIPDALQRGAHDITMMQGSVVAFDLQHDGWPGIVVAGQDSNNDGIPDVLRNGVKGSLSSVPRAQHISAVVPVLSQTRQHSFQEPVAMTSKEQMPTGLLSRIDDVITKMERCYEDDRVKSQYLNDLQVSVRRAGDVTRALDNDFNCTHSDSYSADLLNWPSEEISVMRRAVHSPRKGESRWKDAGDMGLFGGESRSVSTALDTSSEAQSPGRLAAILDAQNKLLKQQEDSMLVGRQLGRLLADLEHQRGGVTQELAQSSAGQQDLLRERIALEATCERYLSELQIARESLERSDVKAKMAGELVASTSQRAEIAERTVDDMKHRAQLMEEAALDARRSAEIAEEARGQLYETNAFQNQATATREQQFYEEASGATRVQAAVEAELQAFRDTAHLALEDRRALQVRVQDLEAELAAIACERSRFEHERKSLHARVRMLEEQRAELELRRQALADENQGLSLRHLADLGSRDTKASSELAALQGEMKVLTDELSRSELFVKSEVMVAQYAAETHNVARGANQIRVQELETELRVTQGMANTLEAEGGTLHKEQALFTLLEDELVGEKHKCRTFEAEVQQFSQDRTQIVELEEELAEVHNSQERQTSHNQRQLLRISELEGLLADAQSASDDHSGGHEMLTKTIADLEQQIAEALAAKESDVKQALISHARILDLEKQLDDGQTASDSHLHHHGALGTELADYEHLLAEARLSQDQHTTQQRTLEARVMDLEEQLGVEHTAKSSSEEQCAALQVRIVELEDELNRARVTLQTHTEDYYSLHGRVGELEGDLAKSLAEGAAYEKRHKAHQGHVAELQEQHVEALARKDAHARELVLSESQVSALKQDLLGSQVAGEQLEERTTAAFADSRRTIARLQAELAETRESCGELKAGASQARQSNAAIIGAREAERQDAGRQQQALTTLRAELSEERSALIEVRTELERSKHNALSFKTELQAEQETVARAKADLALAARNDIPVAELQVAHQALATAHDELHVSRGSNELLETKLFEERRAVADAQRMAQIIDEELRDEQDALVAMRRELEQVQLREEALKRQALDTFTKNDVAQQKFGAEVLERFRDAQTTEQKLREHIGDLESKLASLPANQNGSQHQALDKHDSADDKVPQEISRLSVARKASISGNVRNIPPAYMKIIDQVKKVGWTKMHWARDFTLLHWASKHDMPELCAWFMYQGADPYHRDDTGRNAFDYAQEQNPASDEALAELRRGAPIEKPECPQFSSRSEQPRASQAVYLMDRLSLTSETLPSNGSENAMTM